MWRVARVRLFVSLLHWVRVFHMVFHGPCVRPHLLDSRLIFSACLSPLLVCPPPPSRLPSPLAFLISCPPLLAACLPPPPVSPACLSHLLLLSACLSPLFLILPPVSSACLSPLTSDFAPLCLSATSACLPPRPTPSAPSACLPHLLPLSACLSPLLLLPSPVSSACLSHPLLLSTWLSPLLLLPSPVSSACLSPLPSAPPCLSVFSACLPLAAVALHRCDGSDREPEGAAQRRQVGAVRPRAAPPMLLSSTCGGGGRQAAHTAQCGCPRRLAAVVLPRHSCGGQRPKGYSSERLPYGQ